MVALLALLGAGSALHANHAHAASTQNSQPKTYSLVDPNSVHQQSANQNANLARWNQANLDFSNVKPMRQAVQRQPIPARHPMRLGAFQGINQSVHQLATRQTSENVQQAPVDPQTQARQINLNFLDHISARALKADLIRLNSPAQQVQSTRRVTSRRTQKAPHTQFKARLQQTLAQAHSRKPTLPESIIKRAKVNGVDTDTPDQSFQAFLKQVDSTAQGYVKGNRQNVKEAEKETTNDADKALNKYEAKQSAKYVKRTHANRAQVKRYRNRSVKRLTQKFTKMYNIARAQLGKPYAWGGNGPSAFDCSGFTKYIYWYGMHKYLPRTVGEQYNATKRVSYKHARLGDLVFFNGLSHVGLYLGHDLMVDAQLRGVIVEHVHAPWWNLDGFGRVVGK